MGPDTYATGLVMTIVETAASAAASARTARVVILAATMMSMGMDDEFEQSVGNGIER